MKWLIPLLALVALRASAETTIGPAIGAVPYTITKSGVYHLAKNLAFEGSTGAAITINAAQVEIDMNGYEIECLSGSANTATGITTTGYNRVAIKNGTILGFHTGLSLVSNGATVSGLILTTNHVAGITVLGNNIQITKNRVFATGGAPDSSLHSTGISVTGTDCSISDNDVQTTSVPDVASHTAEGIKLTSCANIYLANNRVLDTRPAVAVNA
ncbi:MAG TPA: hypothetical protein VHY22_14060, partial [Chthoniobacteraceae bacterium]|nr:hypothetical protein [Chthoniobacteraceae bacterium]